LRIFRAAALFRRLLGLALAVAGIAIVANSLPGYVWIFLLGTGLIWFGWLLFRMERIHY